MATVSSGANATSKTFVTAVVTNAALLTIEVSAFLIFKAKLGRIYSPRTYLPPPDKRAEPLPDGPWRWLPSLLSSPLDDVIHKNGLDAYMFLRFVRMMFYIFVVFSFSTMLIMVPVYTVGVHNDRTGLDRITWSNLTGEQNNSARFSSHVVLAYLLTLFVVWAIRREMMHFVHARHKFLGGKDYSRLAQARTVLITNVPDELASEHDLRQFASFVPGGVDRVWIFRDTKALNDIFEERKEACEQLEAAEATYLAQILKAWKRGQKRKRKDEEARFGNSEKLVPTQDMIDELVPRESRPSHRTGPLGLVGTKVDSIEWYRDEISRLNKSIKDARAHVVKGKFLGSAFIRCNLQLGAHVLSQCVSYHEPLKMYDKYMEVNPRDIVWSNLDDGVLEMKTRYITSWAASFGLIIVWTFPSAFIGSLSNLDDVCRQFKWLQWLCDAPSPIPSLVQGVLPPILLAILFAILPFILKALAWYECIPRYSLMQISVYRRFFLFLIFHGFLVVTLTSGFVAAIEGIINEPAKTVQELAEKLPNASIFFLTYMVTQGLAGAGMALIQLIPLIIHYVKKIFLGRTPRQAYSVTFQMPAAEFGLLLPRLSLLAVIGFSYSVISPLINILAMITFGMYYVAWRFLLTQVFDQPDESETAGLYFPMAIENLFVALYVEQVSLAALFFLKLSDSRRFFAEGIAMIVLIVCTIVAHVSVQNSFRPITKHLPMSLATKKMARRYQADRRKSGMVSQADDDIPDFFSKDGMKHLRRRIVKTVPKKLEAGFDDLKSKITGDKDNRPSAETIELSLLNKGKKKEEEAKQKAAYKSEKKRLEKEAKQRKDRIEEEDESRTAGPSFDGSMELRKVTSRASTSSAKSNKSKEELPTFDPPAEAGTDLSDEDEGSDAEDIEMDAHAFDHPSTYVEQAWIWIPADPYGFSEVLVKELKDAEVDASSLGATMDIKGVVEVSRNPPDEEWKGGHDR